MERLESVTEHEQGHNTKLETVTKENCSTTNSAANKSPTNPERLQDVSSSFAGILSSEKCCSDQTELESSQKVLRQTSEQPCTAIGSDFVLTDSHAKTSRPGGSVLQPDTRRRPISYNFAGTRHESYGNLGIAGLAGLSSTSATLALLPLQASGHSRTSTVPSPPVTTSSSIVTSTPPLAKMASTSGTTSLDFTRAEHDAKLASASSRTAASVKDRRSTFFSEPPKPISLPTRSATQLSSLCGGRLSLESQPLTNVPSPSKESNGPSLSVTSVPRSLSGTFLSSTTGSLETQSSPSLQDRPESSQLCPDPSNTLSSQRDVSPMPFSDQSAASMSDSDDTSFSVWCGPPPDDAAGSEPASTTDTYIFELESGDTVADVFSTRHITEELCEAIAQALPSGSSELVTPAKVGNIQKLKAFFGETTPRIMEGKTDSRVSGDLLLQGTDISADQIERVQRSDAVGDATKPMSAAGVEQTMKGKKSTSWVLTSRHHNSHPQLPSTRPKKPLPDREPSLSPKQKEHRKWKGKVVRKFKRHSSSSAVVTSDPPSQPDEITGTFGIPLECCCPSMANEYVPLVVEVCTQVVEERGLANQGIYRVPGNSLAINNLVEELNRDPESASPDSEKWQDVNSVSSLLKLFFRKLPDSLITYELYQCVITANRTENSERRMLRLKKLLHELPEHNFETFRFLAQHLNKVAMWGEQNKMDVHNLAIMFGPTLVRPQDSSILVMARDNGDQCRIVESIITHCDWFFSSWDEDVNVPVDEVPSEPVPISGMSEQLLAKAESLATDTSSHRDRLLSLIHAANRKLRLRDKSKSVENDAAFVPSINGRSKSSTQVHCILGAADVELPRARPGIAGQPVSIRHYPAYHYDTNRNAVSFATDNCKTSLMRRAARSYESLSSMRTNIPDNSSRSGATFPLAYRLLNS